MSKKLWINEDRFIELAENSDNYLQTEIATRVRIDEWWTQFFNTIENPDPVLRKTGYSIVVYDEVKRDSQVSSCIIGRLAGVQKLKWKLEQNNASARAVEIITSILNSVKMHNLYREILDAVFYGYSIQEIVWAPVDGIIKPVKIEQKPHEWFGFDSDNILFRRDGGFDNWVPAEQFKFLLSRNNASYKNPYGEGLLSMCFWPVTFKKGGIQFWAIFLEKFGMPHIYAKLPSSATAEQRSDLLMTLHRMIRDAVAVIPDNSSIDFMESKITGSSDLYERYARYHDGEISKVILGHSAAADAIPGRLGGEDVSLTVREDLVDSDALLICETLNELISWIHQLNPSLGKETPKFVLYEKEGVDKTLAERDQIVVSTGNIKFTKDYYKRAYGFSDNDIIVDEQPSILSSQAQFSEPEVKSAESAIRALAAAFSDTAMQEQMEIILKPIFELRDKAASLQEFREGLIELYPEMDTSKIEQILEGTGLLSAVWGRLNMDRQ